MEQDPEIQAELDEILDHYKFKEEVLRREVSDAHLQEFDCEWQRLPPYLDMNNKIVRDIKSAPQLYDEPGKRKYFFEQWKEQKKRGATYLALVKALLRCKCKQDAENVCLMAKNLAGSAARKPKLEAAVGNIVDDGDGDAESVGSKEPEREELDQDALPMGCFDWDVESEDVQVDEAALYQAHDDLLWPSNKVLKVFFFSHVPSTIEYKNDRVNKRDIIDWMNEWSPGESPVPKFVMADNRDDSDIRIEFSGKSYSRSFIGTAATSKGRNEPTMLLNLGNKDQYLIRYTVLHETGHALGFYHEHQHPDIGGNIDNIFNEDAVIKDLMKSSKTNTKEAARKFYDKNFGTTARHLWKGQTLHPFDKDSVMKYRVKKSWVKERYHALFFADNRQYGDYLWPEAALKGNLTQLDKESAKTVYSQLKGAPVGTTHQ